MMKTMAFLLTAWMAVPSDPLSLDVLLSAEGPVRKVPCSPGSA